MIRWTKERGKMECCKRLILLFMMILLMNVAYSFASATNEDDDQMKWHHEDSALAERVEEEKLIANNPFGITFYKPTYILPVYDTTSPYRSVYGNSIPNQQRIKSLEFKAQLSLKFPLIRRFIIEDSSLNFGYTQLSYWQFYAKSQYFRETNYEPELFWTSKLLDGLWMDAGVVHQSNGRGGSMDEELE